MKKLLAVAGFTAAFSDPLVVGIITPTGTPSTKMLAQGPGVCRDGFGVSVSAITVPSAGATIPDPGPHAANLIATATKTIDGGALALRVDDQTANIIATPQIPGTPPTPYPVTFTVKIAAAGQTKVSGA